MIVCNKKTDCTAYVEFFCADNILLIVDVHRNVYNLFDTLKTYTSYTHIRVLQTSNRLLRITKLSSVYNEKNILFTAFGCLLNF